MKITQVSADYVREHMSDDRLYRLVICDDGNYGKSHASVRMKSVRNLTIDEFEKSLESNQYGFILVEAD